MSLLPSFARFAPTCIIATLALTGCSTYAVPRYGVSAENVSTLRTYKGSQINIGHFATKSEDEGSIMCRGVGPIKTPDGEQFAEYVRKAFISELSMAEVFSPTGPVTLSGTLDDIDFSSTDGAWEMGLTVTSSNGQSIHVQEKYAFTSSWFGETACNQTAQAFMPGVQDLIGKVVRDPGFRVLLGAPAAAPPPVAPPAAPAHQVMNASPNGDRASLAVR